MFIPALFDSTLDMGFEVAWVHGAQALDGHGVSDVYDDLTADLCSRGLRNLCIGCAQARSAPSCYRGIGQRARRLCLCSLVLYLSRHCHCKLANVYGLLRDCPRFFPYSRVLLRDRAYSVDQFR